MNKTIAATVKEKGYLRGLDGRAIRVRHEHAALNTLLQSAGAIICKAWLIALYKLLVAEGYRPTEDFRYCAWLHDELQIAVRTQELADKMDDFSRRAMKEVEVTLKVKCPLDTDCKVGRNWAETH